ncbi:mitogen-activated protein kinase kinase, partial [Tremellales sp. Uapishka_1]
STPASKPIPPPLPAASTSSATSSSLPKIKSSISKKKPPGLDISRSIPQHNRAAPGLPASGTKDAFVSEADRLRDDIARLQLSSKSSSELDSPTTPIVQSDSSSSSVRKKPSSHSHKEGKAKKKDRSGEDKDLVKDEDLEIIKELGAGNGGTVTKVWNKKRGCAMARKLILVDAKPSIRKQILRELQIMNDCSSPYIVGYYGCFPVDVHVAIVIEYMDAGSLDYIYRQHGAVPIHIVGKIAEAVLKGLIYLYDVHRIIHRDIKPSNILANTSGEIKICDFGVSGELINSIANTFVGTSTYMSPERIQGAAYTIKSDVWSLGISLIELALGRFPFQDPPDTPSTPSFDPDATLPLSTQRPKVESNSSSKGVSLGGGGMTMSILDLLQHIVNEPAPQLVSSSTDFPQAAKGFIEGCLDKDPAGRKSPQDLLASEWIQGSKVTQEELRAWAVGVA